MRQSGLRHLELLQNLAGAKLAAGEHINDHSSLGIAKRLNTFVCSRYFSILAPQIYKFRYDYYMCQIEKCQYNFNDSNCLFLHKQEGDRSMANHPADAAASRQGPEHRKGNQKQ